MSKKKQPQEQPQEQPKRQVKVVYYDDGSTIADMSGTRKHSDLPPRQKSTAKEKMRTFFTVMKKMVIPMFITLIAFIVVYIIFLALAGKL